MIELVKTVLNNNKKIADWKITEIHSESKEFFYVLKNLEVNRSTNIREYSVIIYVDFDKYRGSTSINFKDSMNEEEIKVLIDRAIYRCQFVKNPPFKLPCKQHKKPVAYKTNFEEKNLNEWGELISDAIFKADTFTNGWINSTEIFLIKTETHIVNSQGIDLSFKNYYGKIEVIPTWKVRKKEVELYLSIDFGSIINLDNITKEVKRILINAKSRSKAVKLSESLDIKVIINQNEIVEILNNLTSYLNYSAIYRKISPFEINKYIQNENSNCDYLNISLVPVLDYSSLSKTIDSDGVILSKIKLVEDGKCLNYHGEHKFGYYLGIKNPTGIIKNLSVEKGSKSFKDMKSEPYIECVSFSGIQVDIYSDYIGGEVRLAYYYNGKTRIPVTGFSISGSLSNVLNHLRLSKEVISTNGYKGPKYMELPKMRAV